MIMLEIASNEEQERPRNDERWYYYFMIEQTGPPLELTIALLCFCGVLLLIIGVFVVGIMARRDAGKTDTQDKL